MSFLTGLIQQSCPCVSRASGKASVPLGFLVLVLAPAIVWGQGRPQPSQANRGIYEGPGASERFGRVFGLSLSAEGAYDDNILGQGSGNPQFQLSGVYGELRVGPSWRHRSPKMSLAIGSSSSFRTYSQNDPQAELARPDAVTHTGNADVSFRLGRDTTLTGRGGGAHGPYFQFDTLASLIDSQLEGIAAGAAGSLAIESRSFWQGNASTSLDHRFSRATSVRTTAAFGETSVRFGNQLGTRQWSLGGTVTRQLGPGLETTAGYSRTGWTFRQIQRDIGIFSHDATFGLTYTWRHRGARQTTFEARGGPTLTSDQGEQTRSYNFGAEMSHQFGRTWVTRGTFRRRSVVSAFTQADLANTFSIELSGLVTRKIEVLGRGAYFESVGDRFTTTLGSVIVRFAVNRVMAVFTDVRFTRFEFDSRVPLPPGFGRNVDRNSVVVGATFWLPVRERP